MTSCSFRTLFCFGATLTGLILTALSGRAATPNAVRPNFLIVYTDDQRWDSLGLAGHPFLRTPHMDRIGREGVEFKNSFVTSPLCSPARASLLTGQYAHTHGVTTNEGAEEISQRLETFPRALQRAGYRTGYIGKWHMGESAAPRPGFDRWVSFVGQGRYTDPELNVDGRTTASNGYIADVLTDRALEFLRESADKPFCLIVAHKGPHSPFVPAPRHANLYADQKIERRPNAADDLAGKPMLRRDVPGWPAVAPGRGPGDELIRNQLRTLVSIDEGLGRLLAALEQKGELERTVVVFTSDNGYFWGEHGLGDKRAAYEEALRVPLLIRYPAMITAPRKNDALVLNIDLAPTVLQLAGLPVPDTMHGKSLVPLLTVPDPAEAKFRADFLAEYTIQYPDQPRIPTWQAVRNKRWKLIRYPTLPGMDELYDLQADPFELRNLAYDPETSDPMFEMNTALLRLLDETKHPGKSQRVHGVLIDNWHAQTVRGYADARTRTRASLLTDGNFNSGYAIMKPDGVLVPIQRADRECVSAFLAADRRISDIRVRADFYDEGKGSWLAGLWPIFGDEDARFVEQNGVIAMEAEHAQRSDGFRTLALADTSGGFAVQVDAETEEGGGALEFKLEVKQGGIWHVWLRTFAAHHRQNGLALKLNGKSLAAPAGHVLEGTKDIYVRKSENSPAWHWAPEWLPNRAQVLRELKHSGPVTLALAPGVHTLTIVKRKRERPLIDKVVLTIANTPPEQLGPRASITSSNQYSADGKSLKAP